MLAIALALALSAHGNLELPIVHGTKYPNSAAEGTKPLAIRALTLPAGQDPKGFTELLPYIVASPDQDETGSCLYMTLTGIAEWWMARIHPELSRGYDGPLDFSERFLMNAAGDQGEDSPVENWKTDSIYIFNSLGHTVRNIHYPFTKGWFTYDSHDEIVKAHPHEKGAEYGTAYNWLDERPAQLPTLSLPRFHREVIFADPESNPWNTGVMPEDIVERVKTALREKKAPVHVIYLHQTYWHSVFIVGYDDEADNGNCLFLREFHSFLRQELSDREKERNAATNPKERKRLQKEVRKAKAELKYALDVFEKGGGCHAKGAFYVRDSSYEDPSAPYYDYDPTTKGEEQRYTLKTILLEYDWLYNVGNHASQVFAQ